jgi:anti-sigma factor RsiW
MNACVHYAPMIGARPGELSEEETRALAEHLASCDACQARLADEEALAGMLPAALMAEANRRDFSTFSDGVLAKIPQYARPERKRVPGEPKGFFSWVRHHRLAAAGSALAPTLAALALIVYFGRGAAPEVASVEVSSEDRGAMVLETSDGPVVLFGDEEPQGI